MSGRLILESVGSDVLATIVADYARLLQTAAAIYEVSGDHAARSSASAWCQKLSATSRNCHESCWASARTAIETGQSVDGQCLGGMQVYAVPIRAAGRVVGAANFSYGSPPQDDHELRRIASMYGIAVEELRPLAQRHDERGPRIAETAKGQLQTSAKLLGIMIERAGKERELKLRSEELHRLNKEWEAVRSPLRAIEGFLRTIHEEYAAGLAPEARQYFDLIRANARQMAQLIDDLLHFSRLDRLDLKTGNISMNRIVRNVLDDLQHQRGRTKIDIRLRELPDCKGDPVLLRHVWTNLLSNAFKFTRTRRAASVEIGFCFANNCGRPVYFVRDNGIGFDMQYADRLFKVFQRLHPQEDFEGTGVGLAIVERIIKRHQGSVWVQAEPGRGATFYFTVGYEVQPDQTFTVSEPDKARGA
ncbi:MAG: PocR ligand-binding domain-containing protein [Acidobacteria bacterium]|nr:PocR ligand-binding domain-containing protein [Acidobacteriota bacterium]